MSEKYANPYATYNIPLNGNKNDVFHIGCAHLYHFLHMMNDISGECSKPMMLKMHLKIYEAPLAGEENIENNSNKAMFQSVQQLEAKIKALENAIIQLIDCGVKFEKDNIVDKYPEVGSSTIACKGINAFDSVDTAAGISNSSTQSNSNKEQQHQIEIYAGNSESAENKDTEDAAGASKGNDKMTLKEEKVASFETDNQVLIWGIKSFDSSEDSAIVNVVGLARQMGLTLIPDHIKAIYVMRANIHFCSYWVCFRTKSIKDAFLGQKHILEQFPETRFLSIEDETPSCCVLIRNFQSSTSNEDNAIVNVIGLAKQMGLTLIRDQILYIDVIKKFKDFCDYWIYFRSSNIKKAFLEKKHILKDSSKTKRLIIIH